MCSFPVLKCVPAASCFAINSSNGSLWHSVTISSLPVHPLPLFRLHSIVNWQSSSSFAQSSPSQCNLSSHFIHINPSSSCASTLPLTLHLSPSSSSSPNSDVLITPFCPHASSSNVSVACSLGPYRHPVLATTRCGRAAVVSGASGLKVTCKVVQHAWSASPSAFSSSAEVSFLLPSPPVDFGLHCLRQPHTTFAWTSPASPPPHYIAILIARGVVIGQQQISTALPYESLSVKWLLPATAPWVASCVASAYRSHVCVRGASETDFVSTSCPDVPFINRNAFEPSLPPIVDEHGADAACYSQWSCSCVGADVAVPTALGIISNATHGAMTLMRGSSGLSSGALSVSELGALSSFPP